MEDKNFDRDLAVSRFLVNATSHNDLLQICKRIVEVRREFKTVAMDRDEDEKRHIIDSYNNALNELETLLQKFGVLQ